MGICSQMEMMREGESVVVKMPKCEDVHKVVQRRLNGEQWHYNGEKVTNQSSHQAISIYT